MQPTGSQLENDAKDVIVAVASSEITELTIYNWDDDIPTSVLMEFSRQTGIRVQYATYDSQDEAIATLGQNVNYDVVLMDNQNVKRLIDQDLLLPIDYSIVTNFKNISPNFRGLVHDSENRYSIPYTWGTIGIAFNPESMQTPVQSWNAFWQPSNHGKIGMWADEPRLMLGIALKALGYSANSEIRQEVETATEYLIALKPHMVLLDELDMDTPAPLLASGDLSVAIAWSEDYRAANSANPQVGYVLPQEGAILWGDNYVIPKTSQNPEAAAKLINFLLQAEIGAEIMRWNKYPTANGAVAALMATDIQQDPLLNPQPDGSRRDEVLLPLTSVGADLYEEMWQRFIAAP